MFPFDLDEDDELEMVAEVVPDDDTQDTSEYEIDFETMTLTGRMITGIDAVKQWVKICLGIPRYRYPQYPWTYGQDFEELIGQGYSEEALKPMLTKMITEALSQNSEIESLSDFDIRLESDKVIASFVIHTEYGDDDYTHNFIV